MRTIIYAVIGYFVLLLTVRVLARRPGGQLTPFEYVLVFLIGGVIIQATVGTDKSETNSICAVICVGMLHRLVAWARFRSDFCRDVLDGRPVVLLKDGQWQVDALKGVRVEDSDVMAAARNRGMRSLDEVKYAVLERNGGISIIGADSQS